MNDGNPKESYQEYERKISNQDAYRNANSGHNITDDGLGSNSWTAELEKEDHPKKSILPEVEKQIVADGGEHNFLDRRQTVVASVLLKPSNSFASSVDESQITEEDEMQTFNTSPRGILQLTCLNPKFGLRTQLFRAFGFFSAFIITIVLILAVISALKSGENLKSINEAGLKDLVNGNEGNSSRVLAESLAHTLFPKDVIGILHESVRDRFAGYPNDGDEFVPFFDIDSQTNKYPVVGVTGKSLPLDWQIDANVNDDNHKEHVQGRWSWYDDIPLLSTANSFYTMQGMCDPSMCDPSGLTYWENCTAANNDVSTGGVVTPSPTNKQIYRKSSSISPILKAVFESHEDIKDLGIYYSNSGAGAALIFPHYPWNTNSSYTSIGCEWMNAPNPYDPSRSIGTKEEIARCRPAGTTVSSRVYNVLERGWCRDQALNPFTPIVDGPYLDAWNDNQLIVSAGQGIYDRITNNFIGCTYVGLYLDNLEDLLAKSKVTENSQVSVARYDDGTTVASTFSNSSNATETIKIYDLKVGLTFESYEKLKVLVDYNATWDSKEVLKNYENFTLRDEGFVVAIHPIPPVPESYDPNYNPLFFVILSTSEDDLFKVVEDVKDNFDKVGIKVIYMALMVGAIGLGIVLLIIYLMSIALTAPLEYMNAAADEIIHHFGNASFSTKSNDIINQNPGYRCFPRTELDEVVKEFNQIVSSLDFTSALKSVRIDHEELRNGFNMKKDFMDLYESRKEVKFGYKVDRIDRGGTDITQFINLGSNTRRSTTQKSKGRDDTKERDCCRSQLFSWIVILIGTPLLLTTIVISGLVIFNLSKEFYAGIDTAESFYVEVKSKALLVYATLRAHTMSSGASKPIRDLHLLTRYAGWLLFGGVERAVSFTQVKTSVEQCKTFSNTTECPFYEENYFCDCSWNVRDSTCNHYRSDTRHRQDLYFVCEASDTFLNGDRNSTSYPNASYSPETTLWWDDVRRLPGSEKGASASGYETTYDRLRVISASPLHQVVYNQDVHKEYIRSTNVAFEADGMIVTFASCTSYFATASKWSSTEENGAHMLRPELCPLGKRGYDPRCREWYDTGKRLAEDDGIPLYVTPPYAFAGDNSFIGQSATSPLMNPETNEHVGQVLVDFTSGHLLDSLVGEHTRLDDGSFLFLITGLPGQDSVVGPGFSLWNESARPISELVLLYEHNCNEIECTDHIGQFQEIVSSMKAGKTGNTTFTRKSRTGSLETVHIGYAPVAWKSHRPLNSSDFSRGIELQDFVIYSLALAQTENDLLEPFEDIQEENFKKIRFSVAACSVLFSLFIVLVIYIISVVTLSVIDPILVLLDLIHTIKRANANEEPQIICRSKGCKELNSFSNTMQTLYKVAHCGNYVFLSGDLERAYTIMSDASRLFQHLENKKAVSILSNNLGNLLLAAFRSMDETDNEQFCGMSKADLISKGISFYFDAIAQGEEAYDESVNVNGQSPYHLDLLQHLSRCYFNRGMFLLTVKDGNTYPDELEKLGFRDLEIAIDLGTEIAKEGSEEGWGKVTDVTKQYDIALVRIKAYLILHKLGYPDTWDVEEMLDDAFMMVKKEARKDADSSLFQTLKVCGRLQEIETELIRYRLLNGEIRLAAQIAIRMLVDDEYLFNEAHEKALEALSMYIAESKDIDKEKSAALNGRLSMYKTTQTGVIKRYSIF